MVHASSSGMGRRAMVPLVVPVTLRGYRAPMGFGSERLSK